MERRSETANSEAVTSEINEQALSSEDEEYREGTAQ